MFHDTVFHHQMKHLKVCQKYSAACHVFISLLTDETLHLMNDILPLTLMKIDVYLLQVYRDSNEGERFIQFYHVNSYPYLAVLDPRTGK